MISSPFVEFLQLSQEHTLNIALMSQLVAGVIVASFVAYNLFHYLLFLW